ncbi:2-hydroxychromene-2-carboxylate isomerase [Glaciimonas soli]|uniref:2-hydroxychromene-2-carboxylate isomerase n=1 Tax=Glaciimonas soli TaxID=2590999 RepID=A0A843YTY1_9BURK|nr:2-hydroxychromene-2-carboxylate isomerase [Glaciimonas soli]MQR00712.1 2-hydroxychromene-2-carboxylate isomerase [Glaciimonas soli]
MTNKTLEFYFDVGSPTTYLAWTQMSRIQAATGAQIDRKPLLLGGVFKATGNGSPALVPAKAMHMITDLQRFARRYQVPFNYNPHFPIDTLQLMRMIVAVQMHQPDRFMGFTDLIFRGMWIDQLNLGKAEVVADMLVKAGFNPEEIFAMSTNQAVKDQLKANTEEAIKRGAFGAPTFFVGEEMFFGQDRLDFVLDALST